MYMWAVASHTVLSKQCHTCVGTAGHCLLCPLAQSFIFHVLFDTQFVLNAFMQHRLYKKQT